MNRTKTASEKLEVKNEKKQQSKTFSLPTSHFSPLLVPKLRFPEFREAEGWKNKPLSACLDYQQPTPYLVSDTNYSPAFKTPVLTAGKTFILGYTDEEHGIFSQDLPVVIFDDFTTATQFVNFPFKAKSSAMKILQAKNGANIKFMYETLQTLSYEVGAHERHWISNFAPMLVLVPTPPEQQKIADCLSSVDELIAAQARKLDALKTHKKGLMQQLFPREGETQPRLRFPEFQNDGEWVWRMVGDLCDCIVPGRDKPKSFTGKIPWVTIPDIQQMQVHGSLSELGLSPDEIKQCGAKIVPKNAVIMSCVGTFGLVSVCGQDLVINQQLHAWLPNAKINNYYLAYCLIVQKGQMEKLATHTTISYLNKSSCNALIIPIPSPPEQQRIASCLTSLDDLIAAQTQKLEALKTHKKALMQQLFRSPEEAEA